MEELQHMFECISKKSTTAKLWVESLIKPVFITTIFVKAEQEGDYLLHLEMVIEMIPYFFAASHVHYAHYGLYYLRCIRCMQTEELLDAFMKGQHTRHHTAGIWNGI